jgi:hypothetical protein
LFPGDNCGASYLNDNFERLLLERVADEDYLEGNGESGESIIRHWVPIFETMTKEARISQGGPGGRFKVPGLLGDLQRGLTDTDARRFNNNHILLDA